VVPRKSSRAAETRARIVREATQLISLKGYFHTTIDDVLAKTGLTKGGFYAHFDSKEALVRAAIEHATELWVERVLAHASRHVDPVDQLRGLVEGYRLYAVERTFEGGCFFVNLAVELDDQHAELAALVAERFAHFRQMVVAIVEAGKAVGRFRADAPSDALAIATVGYLTGTMMQAKVAGTFAYFDDGNAALERLFAAYTT
jgi:TetR/AcrR family transcriptional regulator, transcriptional repressor for nem operon